MAAIPANLAQTGRRSSSSSRRAGVSHGRGGAGNMGPVSAAELQATDLETPTIKSEVYTTGRGGQGNMKMNTDPAEARRAQDVVGNPRRESDSKTHVGRGGAANVFVPSADDIAAAKRDNAKWESAIAEESKTPREKGLAEKGKEWLFGKDAQRKG